MMTMEALQKMGLGSQAAGKILDAFEAVQAENETLAELGLDSSMLYCDDCKAFLDDLIKQKQ